MFSGSWRPSGCEHLPLSAARQFRRSAGVRKTGGGGIDGCLHQGGDVQLSCGIAEPGYRRLEVVESLAACLTGACGHRPEDYGPVSTYGRPDRVQVGLSWQRPARTLFWVVI